MKNKKSSGVVRFREDLPAGHWLARQLPKGASLRTYAEERAVLNVARAVHDAIEESGLSRANIAELLGTSRSFVSQTLNGSRNMTLKTLGALMWATGQQVKSLDIEPLGTRVPVRGGERVLSFRISSLAAKPEEGVQTEVLVRTGS